MQVPADIDEYGSNLTPELAHSYMYWVRDVSKLWCEQACEKGEMAEARRHLALHDRAQASLLKWMCNGCAICKGGVKW